MTSADVATEDLSVTGIAAKEISCRRVHPTWGRSVGALPLGLQTFSAENKNYSIKFVSADTFLNLIIEKHTGTLQRLRMR